MTQDELKLMVSYRADGRLVWKEREPVDRFSRNFNARFAGKPVGSKALTGYLETAINQERYLVHRLVFLYHRGFFPDFVDHINGDREDNRIDNLREATHSQNMMNVKISKNNNSGSSVKGVYKHGKKGRWRVQVMVDGVLHSKAGFLDMHSAETYAEELREKLHKTFARGK